VENRGTTAFSRIALWQGTGQKTCGRCFQQNEGFTCMKGVIFHSLPIMGVRADREVRENILEVQRIDGFYGLISLRRMWFNVNRNANYFHLTAAPILR